MIFPSSPSLCDFSQEIIDFMLS